MLQVAKASPTKPKVSNPNKTTIAKRDIFIVYPHMRLRLEWYKLIKCSALS